MEPPPFSELQGKRFGATERSVLLSAGSPGSTSALILRPNSGKKTEQESLRRAARRLEQLRIIRIAKLREGVRAHDPRARQPIYRDGHFYVRNERTRRHFVDVLVCWRTDFGESLLNAYRSELTQQRPLRWRRDTYDLVVENARYTNTTSTAWKVAEDDISLVLGRTPEPIEGEVPYIPPGCGPKELDRWDLSVRAAVARLPRAGSARLLSEALEILESDLPTESLEHEASTRASKRNPGKTAEMKALPSHLDYMTQRAVQTHNRNR